MKFMKLLVKSYMTIIITNHLHIIYKFQFLWISIKYKKIFIFNKKNIVLFCAKYRKQINKSYLVYTLPFFLLTFNFYCKPFDMQRYPLKKLQDYINVVIQS